MRHLRVLLPMVASISAVAGYILYCAPEQFDLVEWRASVVTTRAMIQRELTAALAPEMVPLTPEKEISFAVKLDQSADELHALELQLERASTAQPQDRKVATELRVLERAIRIVERLHRSRAAVADAERRTTVANIRTPAASKADLQQTEASPPDALLDFWQYHRPWIGTELQALRSMTEATQTTSTRAFQTFLVALDVDLERVTQAALAVEIRRVDLWIDWASRQPRSRLPAMKQSAIEQVAHLEHLALTTRALKLPPDPRISTLHRDLRRMASVSSPRNWE